MNMSIDESLQREKQISVDPISMKETSEHLTSGSPLTVVKPQNTSKPLPLLPTKYKFLSTSLPNSASSSPRMGLLKSKVKNHNQTQEAASPDASSLARQHSVALSRLAWLRENHLQRSKSCGEGRTSAPSDDFDLWLTSKTNTHASATTLVRGQSRNSSVHGDGQDRRTTGNEVMKSGDEDFKCGALCLFLPGFGKGKLVRARKVEHEEMGHIISRRVSLEKFECGSWRSSAILNDRGESDFSSNLYFDLPLELIQASGNDATLPVSSAFVFDKDVKGVLKTKGVAGGERKSHESSRRHVRFSTSSPTTHSYPSSPASCITPRLRKAREDFNAFLEAQSV